MLKTVVLLHIYFYKPYLWKEQHLFEIEIIFNIINVFTVTLDHYPYEKTAWFIYSNHISFLLKLARIITLCVSCKTNTCPIQNQTDYGPFHTK